MLRTFFTVTHPPDDLIDIQPAVEADSLSDAIATLKTNRIDPKFLYVTPHQSSLWREVFLRHSPIHANPEFARIYRDAFAQIARAPLSGAVWLIGLGCGTGIKERDLCLRLKSTGRKIRFSAIDVSRDLVAESMRNLGSAGAELDRSLVGDLTATDHLSTWLAQQNPETRRVITLFGLVPNLAPEVAARLMGAALRPGDVLLVSAHLAPVDESVDLAAAMSLVRPQYDNPETLAWLNAGLDQLDIAHLVERPKIRAGEIDGIPAFIAEARWKSAAPIERWGHTFHPDPEQPLQVFHSLRYTPALFEDLLRKHGFQFERLALTACREEAIWALKANLI